MIIWIIAGFMLIGSMFAQPPAPAPAPPTASIEGTVTDATSGLPAPDLKLRVNGPTNPGLVKTDRKGHYVLSGLPAGSYHVFVEMRQGFSIKTRVVRVLAGQEVKGIDFKLDRASVLAGRVLDREKKPVAGALISVRGTGYFLGRPSLTLFYPGRTDDLGEFRILDLPPGRYYIEAEPKPLEIKKRQPNAGKQAKEREPVMANVRTYYPGSLSFDGAALMTVHSGELREGLDITLLNEKTVCASSSVVDANSSPEPEQLWVIISEVYPNSQSHVARGQVRFGDDIEVCGLPSGLYRLSAFTNSGGLHFGSEMFTVVDRAVEVPPLRMMPAVPVPGHVTIAEARPEDPVPSGLVVSLEVKDRIRVSGESTSAQVQSSGDFVIPGAVLDEYWLNIRGFPTGFYVKQAIMGGKDVYREAVRVGSGELRIVLGADGPTLTGQAVDDDDQPVVDAAVILAAAKLPSAIAPNEILVATTDQNAAFTIRAMPPGEYRLIAFTGLREGLAGDPEFVRRNLTKAMELDLGPREQKSVKIKVVPAPQE